MVVYPVFVVAAAAAFLVTSSAYAADPAASCVVGKLKASGKYASCVLGADAKAVKSANAADYTKCDEKIGRSWVIAETKGAGQCPGGTGDQSGIQTFLDACRASVAGALETNDTLPVPGGVGRNFTDNGDGTITDNVTGLTWEKLSDDESIHDKDHVYNWTDAASVKVEALNSASFAGYNDWRLPDRFELETLVSVGASDPATYASFNADCTPGATVLTGSCTVPSNYWSSTSILSNPTFAWIVDFFLGNVGGDTKTTDTYVRAVRSGLP